MIRMSPSIMDGSLPVTRLKIVSIVAALSNTAEPFVGIENWSKLWKRLLPVRSPPSITKFTLSVVVIAVESVPSEVTLAKTETLGIRVMAGETSAIKEATVIFIKRH